MGEENSGEPPYSFEFVAAPEDLQPYLNSLYVLRAPKVAVDEMLPAYSGQLLIMVEGAGQMHFDGHGTGKTIEAFFLCTLLQAQKFELTPPTLMLGASLNFRGWAAITGLPINEHHDDFRPIDTVLPPALAARIASIAPRVRSGELSERDALGEMASVLRDALRPLAPRHNQVIDTTLEWLSSSFKPEIEDLQDKLPYSERQVQRLVTRFFGQPPVRLIRRYRAVRAATLLSMPNLDPALESEIRDAFYDQAHMIKEIRYFTGRTPRRLLPKENSVINEMLGPDGYSSVDLFGGSQDEQLGRK